MYCGRRLCLHPKLRGVLPRHAIWCSGLDIVANFPRKEVPLHATTFPSADLPQIAGHLDRLVLRIRLLTTQSARSSGVSRPKGQRTNSSPIADRVVRLVEQPASAW